MGFVAPTPVLVPAVVKRAGKRAQVLNLAADLIQKYGLEQGSYHITRHGICTITAVRMASDSINGREAFPYEALNKLQDYLKLSSWSKIPSWNDNLLFLPKFRVIRALRAAAKEV